MASNIQGKSPVREDSALSPVPLNSMHTSTADFFRWHVVKAMPMVPRDVINFNVDSFVESAPNPFPINGSMTYGLYCFFVPHRLAWKDWLPYYLGLQTGLTPPYFTVQDLWDIVNPDGEYHLDEPYRRAILRYILDIDNLSSLAPFLENSVAADIPQEWFDLKLDAMPLREAQLAWFWWMRDKMHISDNAKSSYVLDTGGHISKEELRVLITPKYRNFAKNMFTAAYDDPQEGVSQSMLSSLPSSSQNPGFSNPSSPTYPSCCVRVSPDGNVGLTDLATHPLPSNSNGIIASTSINEARLKNAYQQYTERMLVLGKTLKSRALGMCGISPTIEELQMPALLGGKDFDLEFKTHQSTVSSSNNGDTGSTPVGSFGLDPRYGNIAGQKGQNVVSSDGMGLQNITYKCDESGYFFCFGCVTPNVQYYQGLSKNWTAGLDTFNSDKFDFFHSDFENQPFEPVLFYEVCANPYLSPKKVFGFQNMYSRYKQAFDSLGGDYVLQHSENLMSSMHLGRDIFTLLQSLATGGDYDEVLTPANLRQATQFDTSLYDTKFTIGDSGVDHFSCNHKFKINMLRPMQLFCLPSLDSDLSRVTPKSLVDTGGFSI